MADLKNQVQGIDANLNARDIADIASKTGNLYEALAIITKRANQVNVDLKLELHKKLEDFAVTSEAIEEVHENKEQIEISKFYERLPNPAIIAYTEFMDNGINHEYTDRVKGETPDIIAD